MYSTQQTIIALNAVTPVTVTDASAAWTGSTTWSITSLTGCAIVETALNSPTSVTLRINTGITLGFLTVSDSSDSDTIQLQVGATAAYGSESTLNQRWGQDSIQQWSQLRGDQPYPDSIRINQALAYADAEIQTFFAYFGNYSYPL